MYLCELPRWHRFVYGVGAVGTLVLFLAGGIGILKLAAYWVGIEANMSQGE